MSRREPGRLGHHEVAAGAVHFAGAWSAYGPLSAGPEGLRYFTLRNRWDPGARYMELPENRSARRARPRQHRESVGMIAVATDGLCVEQLVVASGEPITGIDPASGAGQFWLALSGHMISENTAVQPKSCLFVSPDEPPFAAIAGADGATLLLLQFPRDSRPVDR